MCAVDPTQQDGTTVAARPNHLLVPYCCTWSLASPYFVPRTTVVEFTVWNIRPAGARADIHVVAVLCRVLRVSGVEVDRARPPDVEKVNASPDQGRRVGQTEC